MAEETNEPLNDKDRMSYSYRENSLSTEEHEKLRMIESIKKTSLWGNFLIALGYVVSDTRKQKRSFVIGVTTVFLVVCFLSLIENVLVRSDVVFVKLAEDQVGQCDVILSPKATSQSDSFFLNYTSLNETLSYVSTIKGCSPRWIGLGSMSSTINLGVNSSVILLILDSDIETKVGVGKSWTHRKLGKYETHLTASTSRALGIAPQSGQRALLQIDPFSILSTLGSGSSDFTSLIIPLLEESNPSIPFNSTFNVPPLPANGTAFLDGLGLNSTVIKNILDSLPSNATLSEVLASVLKNVVIPDDTLVFSRDFTVIDAIEDPKGKYPALLGNVAVLERGPFEEVMKDFILELINNPLLVTIMNIFGLSLDGLIEDVNNFNMMHYALTINIMFEKRTSIYTQKSDDRQIDLIERTDEIFRAIGINYPASIQTPVEGGVKTTQFISMFLNEIFFMVIGVLVMLAILLIYSLLLTDVEEKTFEYAMLRTLGLPQRVLVVLLTIQAFYFSIPGVLFGFLICFLLYIPLEFIVSWYASISVEMYIRPSSLTLGLVLGFLLPLFGVLLPIRKALSRTLRDALDIYHNSVNDSIVKIQKLESLDVSVTETIIALILVVLGFIVYYLVPLSFLFNNLPMFLRILTMILLAMVFGQVLLFQSADYVLERFFVTMLMWGPDRKLIHIVLKNLSGHRTRNQKTAIMFTLCLGFVIFAATMFVLQAKSIPQNLEWATGADIYVTAFSSRNPLPEKEIREYLETVLISSNQTSNLTVNHSLEKIVVGFTFTTFNLIGSRTATNGRISAAASSRSRSASIIGLEDNFLDVAFNDYYLLTDIDNSMTYPMTIEEKPDIIKGLYLTPPKNQSQNLPQQVILSSNLNKASLQSEGLVNETIEIYQSSFPVVVSSSLKAGAYLNVNTKMQLSISYRMKGEHVATETVYNLVSAIAMVKKFPSFLNINRFQSNGAPVFMTIPQYETLYKKIADLSLDPVPDSATLSPKQHVLVRVSKNATLIQVEGIINSLNSFLTTQQGNVLNLRQQVEQTKLASFLILLFFDIVAIIGLIFSFFVLWLSFTANVRENSWEYGVLRAVGLVATTVSRLYIYEALSIVLSTLVLGTTLGLVTAVVLTLQINLFTELPFEFNFPSELFALVIILSLVIAVLGSYYPAKEFQKKEIAIALRG